MLRKSYETYKLCIDLLHLFQIVDGLLFFQNWVRCIPPRPLDAPGRVPSKVSSATTRIGNSDPDVNQASVSVVDSVLIQVCDTESADHVKLAIGTLIKLNKSGLSSPSQ